MSFFKGAAVKPKDETAAFMPAPSKQDLVLILCRRSFRKTTGGSTVSWKGQKWIALQQRGRKALFRRGIEVVILNLLDGQMVLQHKDAFYKLVETLKVIVKPGVPGLKRRSCLPDPLPVHRL